MRRLRETLFFLHFKPRDDTIRNPMIIPSSYIWDQRWVVELDGSGHYQVFDSALFVYRCLVEFQQVLSTNDCQENK